MVFCIIMTVMIRIETDAFTEPFVNYWSHGAVNVSAIHTQLPSSHVPKIDFERPEACYPMFKEKILTGLKSPAEKLPRLQHFFDSELSTDRDERIQKQLAIVEAFNHSWSGYKAHAKGHDTLLPLTGGYSDGLNGWGATLVDSLDTLWIMGFEAEFADAVVEVQQINFTQATSDAIPLFETTIRYLGGLISAFDLSSNKILLEKAVELAEVLICAFDTQNHMPTRYLRPFSAQLDRSDEHMVLAELGSLVLEFSRLTQITKDDRYYDAVARVSRQLYQWQNLTSLPGLWPIRLDASGRSDQINSAYHGLLHEPQSTMHTYSLGALADSAYEYLPKTYALLGGRDKEYKKMYLQAMDVVRHELLYKPMVEGDWDILFAGDVRMMLGSQDEVLRKDMIYEPSHLGCFAGGMFALGSRLFNVSSDLVLASKLTNGCVWAYASMPTEIMPDWFSVVPCKDSKNCAWNESAWHTALDPDEEQRTMASAQWHKTYVSTRIRGLEGHQNSVLSLRDSASSAATGISALWTETPQLESSTSRSPPARFTRALTAVLPHDQYVAVRIMEERLPPGYTKIIDPSYRLRPEAIESVFMMYRVTGDKYWQEKGWEMFNAIQGHTVTRFGNAALADVSSAANQHINKMESFWHAETLKYLYLLFSEPSMISLDDFVL